MDFPERLEQKKKSPPSRNRSPIGRLPKKPDADHQEKRPAHRKYDVKKLEPEVWRSLAGDCDV
jgi:hypothetical protein